MALQRGIQALGIQRQLTLGQQTLIEEIALWWRTKAQWPRMARLELDLTKKRVDVHQELESLPQQFWSTEGGPDEEEKRIRLTLLGIEATEHGLLEVGPILQLVLRMVERVLANPEDRVHVSSVDLAEILGSDRASELPRLGAVFVAEWQGGSVQWPDGRWEVYGTVFDLRFEGVSSAAEYYLQRMRPWPTQDLENSHGELLREIHQHRQRTGEWPHVIPFVIAHQSPGDVLATLQEIPLRFLRSFSHDLTTLRTERLEISFEGVVAVAPEREPTLLARALPLLVAKYRETAGEAVISAASLSQQLKVPEPELTRLKEVLSWEHRFGLRFVASEPSWSIRVQRAILQWEGVCTLEQLLERGEEIKKKHALEMACWNSASKDDDLDRALSQISETLIEPRAGAWSAIVSNLPDSLRQAAHSGRELIDQTLKLGAPDDAVRAAPGFVPDGTSSSGITRRHRLRYLMAAHGNPSESQLRVAEKACQLLEAAHDRLKALAHSRAVPNARHVEDSLRLTEIVLRSVLLGEEMQST